MTLWTTEKNQRDGCSVLQLVSLLCVCVCVCTLAEVSVVLKVDSRLVGRSHWRHVSNEAWDQSFSIELERVSGGGSVGQWEPRSKQTLSSLFLF